MREWFGPLITRKAARPERPACLGGRSGRRSIGGTAFQAHLPTSPLMTGPNSSQLSQDVLRVVQTGGLEHRADRIRHAVEDMCGLPADLRGLADRLGSELGDSDVEEHVGARSLQVDDLGVDRFVLVNIGNSFFNLGRTGQAAASSSGWGIQTMAALPTGIARWYQIGGRQA